MALKFVALFVLVCAVQAQPPNHEWSKYNPLAHWQIVHDKLQDRLQDRLQNLQDRYSSLQLFNKPQKPVGNQENTTPAAAQETPEPQKPIEKENNSSKTPAQCLQEHLQEFEDITKFAENYLQELSDELKAGIDDEALLAAIDEKTAEAIQIIRDARKTVKELAAQGKINEALGFLNASRTKLDAKVKEIPVLVSSYKEKYPGIDEKAKNMDDEYYKATYSKITAYFLKLQKCMGKGKN